MAIRVTKEQWAARAADIVGEHLPPADHAAYNLVRGQAENAIRDYVAGQMPDSAFANRKDGFQQRLEAIFARSPDLFADPAADATQLLDAMEMKERARPDRGSGFGERY